MGACSLKKARETLEKLKRCAENEHCENMDCMYFIQPEELESFIGWAEELMENAEEQTKEEEEWIDEMMAGAEEEEVPK